MRSFIAAALISISLPVYGVQGVKAPPAFDSLISLLLDDIRTILSISITSENPSVYFADNREIAEAYCRPNEQCNVVAITDEKTGVIYITSGLELNNPYNVSILFHELVHFVQVKNKMFDNLDGCERWAAAEHHAYSAQSNWLRHNNLPGFKVPNFSEKCK